MEVERGQELPGQKEHRAQGEVSLYRCWDQGSLQEGGNCPCPWTQAQKPSPGGPHCSTQEVELGEARVEGMGSEHCMLKPYHQQVL